MLPASEGWQPLHPLSPLFKAGRMVVVAFVIGVQVVGFTPEYPILALTLLPLVGGLTAAYVYIAWIFLRYRIGSEHFEMREGVLFRTQKRVPLARLESVDIARPWIARILTLAEVRVEVAGASDSEVRLRYLSEDRAVVLRSQLLRARSEAQPVPSETSSVEQPPEVAEGPPVAVVEGRDLILGHLAGPVITMIAIVSPLLLLALFISYEAIFPIITVFAITVTGMVIASATTIERSWNFRLSHGPEGLIVRRGLFNLLTQKVPLHRVQAVRVESPLLWRMFDRSRLIVDIAGYGGGTSSGADTTSVLLPIGKSADVDKILTVVMPGMDLGSTALEPAPDDSKWRSPLFWRTYAVAMTDGYAVTRAGFFRRRLDIVPHRKVQSLRITQGPWQRPLGLANLHFDTAGANVEPTAKQRAWKEAHFLAARSRSHSEGSMPA